MERPTVEMARLSDVEGSWEAKHDATAIKAYIAHLEKLVSERRELAEAAWKAARAMGSRGFDHHEAEALAAFLKEKGLTDGK